MTCAVGAGWSCALVHTHACAIVVGWPVFWRCWGRLHLGFCAARAVVCHPFVGTGGVRVAALRTVRTGERKAAASKLQAQSLCCGTAGVLAVRRTCWSWWREGGGIEKGKAGGREVRTQLYFQLVNGERPRGRQTGDIAGGTKRIVVISGEKSRGFQRWRPNVPLCTIARNSLERACW